MHPSKLYPSVYEPTLSVTYFGWYKFLKNGNLWKCVKWPQLWQSISQPRGHQALILWYRCIGMGLCYKVCLNRFSIRGLWRPLLVFKYTPLFVIFQRASSKRSKLSWGWGRSPSPSPAPALQHTSMTSWSTNGKLGLYRLQLWTLTFSRTHVARYPLWRLVSIQRYISELILLYHCTAW